MEPLDRRIVLGGAFAAAISGLTVALLKPQVFGSLGIGRGDLSALLRQIRAGVDDTDSLAIVAAEAVEALRHQTGEWSSLPSKIQQAGGVTFEEIVISIRDDYSSERILPVVGWIISKSEAEILTLL